MDEIANNGGQLTGFEKFQEKVILYLHNYNLHKLNPIFTGGGAFFDHGHRIDIIYPILDVKIEPAVHPSSTFNQPEYLPAPVEDKELVSWFAYSKKRIVVKRSDTQSGYKIYTTLLRIPFYLRPFLDAAEESFKSSTVFISDGLPYELRVYVYPQRNYMRSKSEDLRLITSHLLGIVDEETEEDVRYIWNFNFGKATYKILKLSGQPMDTDVSFCLACGIEVEKEDRFCNSEKIHGRENPGNCRNKFHNWLERRLGVRSKEEKHKERERLHRELQEIIRTEGPSKYAFKTFRHKHPELYEERPRGPKKKKGVKN